MSRVMGFSASQGIIVFAVAGFGVLLGGLIAPVPLGAFWPETAILLALFVHRPAYAHPLGWALALFGLLASGLVFQPYGVRVFAEAAINLAGVFVAWQVLYTCDQKPPSLARLQDLGRLAGAATLGAMTSAVFSALLEGALHGGQIAGHFALTWSGQLIGYLLLVPALLSFPKSRASIPMRRSDFHPLFAMILAFVAALLVGGVGVCLLPMLVLLWAGFVYAPWVAAWASLVTGFATLTVLPSNTPLGLWAEVACRTAFAFWLVLPIGLAILRRQGALRGLLWRRRGPRADGALAAFRQEAQRLLDGNTHPLAVLRVEVQMRNPSPDMRLSERFAEALREKDVVGELSPRDFVLVLGNCPPEQARRVASRLLNTMQSDANFGPWFDLHFGIASLADGGALLDHLVDLADKALSQSKVAEEAVVLTWQGS